VRVKQATPEEWARFQELHQAESRGALELDPEQLYEFREVAGPPSRRARIHATVVCARYGNLPSTK